MSLIKRVKERQAAGLTVDAEAAATRRATIVEQIAAEAETSETTDAATTVPQPRHSTPAQRHRLRVIAMAGKRVLAASGVDLSLSADNDGDLPPEIARLILQLRNDQRTLKTIQSTERKVEAKATMVGAYQAWCQAVIAAGEGIRGPADEVFTTIAVWLIDIGDYAAALPMIGHLLRYGLAMPSRIDRTPATFVTEEIAEAAIKALRALPADAESAVIDGWAEVLANIDDLVELEDMPDQVRAKLHKAMGMAVHAGIGTGDRADDEDRRRREEETLKRYLRALELHDAVGVKKEIDQLQRSLKKEPTAS